MKRRRGWLAPLGDIKKKRIYFIRVKKQNTYLPQTNLCHFNHQEQKKPYISPGRLTLLSSALSTVLNLRGIN